MATTDDVSFASRSCTVSVLVYGPPTLPLDEPVVRAVAAAIANKGGVTLAEMQGTGAFAVFARSADAVACALTLTRINAPDGSGLVSTLPLRAAVYTAETPWGSRDSIEQVMARAGSLIARAHVGQILLSATAAATLGEDRPADCDLIDLGAHPVAGSSAIERIWQLGHPSLRQRFPPLRICVGSSSSLPSPRTRLQGRRAETTAIVERLGYARLVTLVGAPGIGKSRLAIAAATAMLPRCPGGVWWVELGLVDDAALIGAASLRTLGEHHPQLAVDGRYVGAVLGGEPAVLVLDNCEHLVEGCAAFVDELLAANAAVTVLATSREPLRLTGEVCWSVPPLSFPQPGSESPALSVRNYDAVALFVERAQDARPGFGLTAANAAAIVQICQRLDGLPLAIELVAARCRQVSAQRLAVELDGYWHVLSADLRTTLPRHRTVAAAVDWTYQSLSSLERTVFRRLSVFVGQFPLAAANSVLSGIQPALTTTTVDAMLSTLVDKSLVIAIDGGDNDPEYRLLHPVRAFARSKALAAGEVDEVSARHASWWTDWLEPRFMAPTDDALNEATRFHDNLLVAVQWSTRLPELGLRMLSYLARLSSSGGWDGLASAAERLLATENALAHPRAWLAAALECRRLYEGAFGPNRRIALDKQIHDQATALNDTDQLTLLQCLQSGGRADLAPALEACARRGDRYLAGSIRVASAESLAWAEPRAAFDELDRVRRDTFVQSCPGLRVQTKIATAVASLGVGDLRKCIAECSTVVADRRHPAADFAVGPISNAALLNADRAALKLATDCAENMIQRSPGVAGWAHTPLRRLHLLNGGASDSNPARRWHGVAVRATHPSLWIDCRQAIDAGAPSVAVDLAREQSEPTPSGRAVAAAVAAAAFDDEHQWHHALALAVDADMRLIVVDALEGLAAAAATNDSIDEAVRLLVAAERLREETGYRWRFANEQRQVDRAWTAANQAIDEDHRHRLVAEGQRLDWRQAAEYARRAHGQRQRPRLGWASLTPTELKVAELISSGCTNPQIGERLFIHRSTVKTHLEHIYTKLGIHSRSELSAQAALSSHDATTVHPESGLGR